MYNIYYPLGKNKLACLKDKVFPSSWKQYIYIFFLFIDREHPDNFTLLTHATSQSVLCPLTPCPGCFPGWQRCNLAAILTLLSCHPPSHQSLGSWRNQHSFSHSWNNSLDTGLWTRGCPRTGPVFPPWSSPLAWSSCGWSVSHSCILHTL